MTLPGVPGLTFETLAELPQKLVCFSSRQDSAFLRSAASVLPPGPLLAHLENPNLSLPLFLLGLLLLYLDFNVPGKVLPAALGTLCLSLALYGLIHTPQSPGYLLLTLLTVALILADLIFPTKNVLPILATLTLAYALFRLAGVPNAPHRVHPLTALLTATGFSIVTLKLGRIALLARRNKAVKPRQTR